MSFIIVTVLLSLANTSYAQTYVSGNQSGTWTKAKSPYILSGTVNIPNGQTLTIQPGVTVKFPSYAYSLSVNGQLLAQGTTADSIRFMGSRDAGIANSNYGGSVFFNTSDANSIVEYTAFDSLGDKDYFGDVGVINISAPAKPVIRNASFRHRESSADIKPWIGGCENIAGDNLVIALPSGNFSDNSILPKLGQGSYYMMTGAITILDNAIMTISPGAEIRFSRYNYSLAISGTLHAEGTPTDSIRFKGVADPTTQFSNYGGTLFFYSNSIATLKYVSIDSMGDKDYFGDVGVININSPAKPTISNSSIRHSETPFNIKTWLGGCENISGSNLIVALPSGNISENSTLPKLGAGSWYMITGMLNIMDNTTLTIGPGADLHFPGYNYGLGISGTLLAQGTATDSIYFRGMANPVNPTSTHGGPLFIYGNSHVSLQYVSIDSMGDKDYYGDVGSINITSPAKPSIHNSTIRHGETPFHIKTWIGGCENISGNNLIVALPSGNIAENGTLPKLGSASYYLMTGTIDIPQNTNLTIAPGVEIHCPRFNYNIVSNGTLIARGTATDSIRIKGSADLTTNPNSSHGGSLLFYGGSGNSILEYVSIDSMGDKDYNGDIGAIYSSAGITFRNSSIRHGELSAIVIIDSFPSIANNNITTTPIGILASGDNLAGVMNNDNIVINIRQSNITRNTTWPWPGKNSYYSLLRNLIINQNILLTLTPGTLINFPDMQSNLIVQGSLHAEGTEAKSIQFAKITPGGSTAYGGTIAFYPTATNSILNYITVNKLGSSQVDGAGITIESSNLSINNSTISGAEQYGVYIYNNSAPAFRNCTITNNPTGVINLTGRPTFTACTIAGNISWGINNTSNSLLDVVDARNCWWGDATGPLHTATNPSGLGNRVSDKVLFNPWSSSGINTAFNDIGISAISSPVSDCSLGNASTVAVKITNYGNTVQSGFNVIYQIDNNPLVTENVGTLSLLPGTTADYTFTTKANLSATAAYTLKTFTRLAADSAHGNDSAQATIRHLANLPVPTQLKPVDLSTNLTTPLSFSWAAVDNANAYDLYYWKNTDLEPGTPAFPQLNQVSIAIPGDAFKSGTTYKWKVVARQGTCTTASAVQTFSTQVLPDLVIDSIIAPTTALSESDITVRYIIKNRGAGNTTRNWNDIFYFSSAPQLVWGTQAQLIASNDNFSQLNAGQSYTSADIAYHIPIGTKGVYYIFGTTNAGNLQPESSDSNNTRTAFPISITLAPPPDLQVTSLVVNPLTAFSGDSLLVSYTVKNKGAGPTSVNSWQDRILLSDKLAFDASSVTELATVNHTGSLAVDGEYTVTQKITLPPHNSGTFYLYVYSDIGKQLFEDIFENNNTAVSPALTLIERPAPNLMPTDVNVSADTITNNQVLTIGWVEQNTGAAVALSGWADYVYLSPSPTFDEHDAVATITFFQNDVLRSLQSRQATATLQIPSNLPGGKYYIFVKSDANNTIYEGVNENDNVAALNGIVTIVNPDLHPTELHAPATAISEETIAVSWSVNNNSSAGIYNSKWTDKIYLSADTLLDGGDKLLSSTTPDMLMAPRSNYSRLLQCTLPAGISGDMYLLLVTDGDNALKESIEDNNSTRLPLHITLSPWADLIVKDVFAPSSDTVGGKITISYALQNTGSGSVSNGTWRDDIYLSPSGLLNDPQAINIGSLIHSRMSMSPGETYNAVVQAVIPDGLPAGQYKVVVIADASGNIFENTGENNNQYVLNAITIVSIPPIDLALTGGQITSADIAAGKKINVQWTVNNTTASTTAAITWLDAVYLSNNPILDPGDRLLGSFSHSGPLSAGASYTQQQSVTLPYDMSGTLYLIVQADKNNQQNDPNRGNNYLALGDNGGDLPVIHLPETIPADLTPLSLDAPRMAFSGQPIAVGYTVKNVGSAITSGNFWVDKFYLSTDNILDDGDFLLGTSSTFSSLAVGAQYSGSPSFTLPASFSGHYYLLVKTNADNNIYEGTLRNNNTAFSLIDIAQQLPSDLEIRSISVPALPPIAGANTTVSWQIFNNGANTATGYLRDAIYISADTTWDAGDILLGSVQGVVEIAAQDKLVRSFTGLLPNISPGDYYVIVRTDIQNNIVEMDETNNALASSQVLHATVKELSLDVTAADTLANNQQLYYRIVIPDALKNETLSIQLTGDAAHNAANRLFVKFGSLPTSNDYEYTAAIPFSDGQQAIVPALQAGTLYIMATGVDTAASRQNATLLASIIPFSITRVETNQGGNTGSVTVKVSGARFEPTMTLRLQGSSTILAQNIRYINSTTVFATFDLTGQTIGMYTLGALNSAGKIASLANGFTIVQGSPGGTGLNGTGFTCAIKNVGYENNFVLSDQHQPTARVNTTAVYTIFFQNTGNVDMPIQRRMFISPDSVFVNFVPDYSQKLTQLLLEFKETDGPPDIIRPGASGYIRVYALIKGQAHQTFYFLVVE